MTRRVAGVIPNSGNTRMPGSEEVTSKSVACPLVSSTRNSIEGARVSQKFAWRKICSSEVTSRRSRVAQPPTGRIISPLSEIAYKVAPSEVSALRPARFSGSWSRSRIVRLSASATISTGGSPSCSGTCA